jgi:hypothetical protein
MKEIQEESIDWFACKSRDSRRRPGRIISKHHLQGGAAALCNSVSILFDGEEVDERGVVMTLLQLRPREQALKEISGNDSFTGKIQTSWRDGGMRLPARTADYSKAKWNKTVVDVLRKDLPESLGQYQIIYQLNDGGVVGNPEVIKL